MGYRSDVAIGFCFKDEEEKVSFLGAVRVAGDEHMWKAVCEYSYVVENRLMYVRFDDVKWYESYEDVGAHRELLAMAEEREIPNVFARRGEELNDIELQVNEYDRGETVLGVFDGFGFEVTMHTPTGGVPVINKGGEDDNQP